MGCFNSKSTTEKSAKHVKPPRSAKKSQSDAAAGSKPHAAPENTTAKKSDAAVGSSSSTGSTSSAPRDSVASADQFFHSVLEGSEHFLTNLPDPQSLKQIVALTFMNSCVEVARTKFRLRMEKVVDLLDNLTEKLKLPLLKGCLPHVEERSMDDGFSRVLLAWIANNPRYAKKISAEAGQNVLDTLYIRYVVNKSVNMEDILVYQLRWATVCQASLEVFAKVSEGKDSMTAEQMGKFLRETQRAELTDRQVTDKFKYRFGGGIHRYNFANYMSSVLTNNAVDPGRISNVWQDMTQSFTHYCVGSVRVETEEDVTRAMTDGTRALVLNLTEDKDGKIYAGKCPFQSVVDTIKKQGFANDTYPIVLCLSPQAPLSVAIQDRVAKILNETLGNMLAKGLMFEGAVISDPKFSPGALRKKVLVMGTQSRLKPFIGFVVADMNKDGLGVRVTDVVDGAPAAKGGVLKGDWLTHVDNEPILNKQHLRECLAKKQVGEEFTVKRENLDVIKIVTGGVVDTQDKTTSAAYAGLIFFKYSKDPNPRPWDAEKISATSLTPDSKPRKELMDHFSLVTLNQDAQTKTPVDYEGIASRVGIHLIDTDNSERSLAWLRGRFSDNGRCGYLLKSNLEVHEAPELTINIIGGPRAVGSAPLANATVVLHGSGSVRHSGSQLTFTGCDQSTIAVVKLVFEANGSERSFTASFAPNIVRQGYRALPSIPTGEERALQRQIHSIFCFVKQG